MTTMSIPAHSQLWKLFEIFQKLRKAVTRSQQILDQCDQDAYHRQFECSALTRFAKLKNLFQIGIWILFQSKIFLKGAYDQHWNFWPWNAGELVRIKTEKSNRVSQTEISQKQSRPVVNVKKKILIHLAWSGWIFFFFTWKRWARQRLSRGYATLLDGVSRSMEQGKEPPENLKPGDVQLTALESGGPKGSAN